VVGRSGGIEKAFAIFHEMRKCAHNPDAKLWSVLIELCTKNGVRERGFEILNRVVKKLSAKKNGPLLSISRFDKLIGGINALIFSYAKDGSFEHIYDVLLLANELKIKPDQATFTGLINACTQCENGELAIDFYYTLCRKGIKLDDILVTNILTLCKQQCQLLRAGIKPKNWCSSRNLFGDAIVSLLGEKRLDLQKSDGWEKFTMQTYQEAMRSGVKPSVHLLNLAVASLRKPVPAHSRFRDTSSDDYWIQKAVHKKQNNSLSYEYVNKKNVSPILLTLNYESEGVIIF
jgi:pentatricopeptide repeat protein